jgi:ABC-type branched-subunit amino acid transport system ATPase component
MEVSGLAVGYGRSVVVHEASLSVRSGEIAVIVGPNGSGKSTLLKGIIGLLRPYSGTVVLNTDSRRDVTGMPPEETVRLGVSYVPQLANVFPSLTVAENLIAGLQKRRVKREGRLDKVYTLFPDLHSAARRPARTLSGGQRMMLALGRALMTDPAVVIVDEPCAGLSPKYRDVVWEQLTQLRDAGVALLVVEQNTRAALAAGDYGHVLVSGRILRQAPASELLVDTDIVDLYIGRTTQPTDEQGPPNTPIGRGSQCETDAEAESHIER